MKKPCFDKYEREMIAANYKPMMERYKMIKAGRDLERQLKKDISRLLNPIIDWIGRRLTPKIEKK